MPRTKNTNLLATEGTRGTPRVTRLSRRAFAPLLLALMAACGGGGGDADATDVQTQATEPGSVDLGGRESALADAPASFKHPGIFMSQTRLDTFKAAANSSSPSAMKTGFAAVAADSRSSASYAHKALASVEVVAAALGPQEQRYKDDAMAAYLNTLMWVKTGDATHKNKAIAILNDWARTFQKFTAAPGTGIGQARLEAAWMLPVWADTAEILRHYGGGLAGWSSTDITAFSGFIDKLYDVASQASYLTNNWGVSASLAMMSAGVFQNNKTRYASGLTRLLELVPSAVSSSGEVNELKSRDCVHPQYNLTGLVQGGEMASIQGNTSVWTLKPNASDAKPRLALGLEYMAKALTTGAGVRNCTGAILEAGYADIAVNGYMNRGIAIPNFQALAKARRPDRSSYQFLGWTTASHGRDDY